MAPTTTVIDAGKDLPDNHTPTFAKEPIKSSRERSGPFTGAFYYTVIPKDGEYAASKHVICG